jgi:phosphomethylpyrimidine synthase
MTQLESARSGKITAEMERVAVHEGLDAEYIRRGVSDGTIVIPANINHTNLTPYGIGKGLSTKVNANIGTSSDFGNRETELQKLKIALDSKADAVMDLSTGGDIPGIRRAVISACPVPVGTVPVYPLC